MSDEFTITQLVQCVRRELGHRKRVYKRAVDEGRMDPAEAVLEIAMMTAIRDNLESQQQPKLF